MWAKACVCIAVCKSCLDETALPRHVDLAPNTGGQDCSIKSTVGRTNIDQNLSARLLPEVLGKWPRPGSSLESLWDKSGRFCRSNELRRFVDRIPMDRWFRFRYQPPAFLSRNPIPNLHVTFPDGTDAVFAEAGMPTESDPRPRGVPTGSAGLILPVLVLLALLVVIVPVPPVVLDLLLAANLTSALVLLLAVLFVRRPLDFSAFPSLLLLTTLGRLVLNVASTRLVLTRAATHGTSAAGHVIHTFATFVAQDQIVVGLVIFSILVVIQLVVVTRGATRLSEVAARFALDGMPGRQLAVDAVLNAGAITAEEAKRRRAEIAARADFYAAMDGQPESLFAGTRLPAS